MKRIEIRDTQSVRHQRPGTGTTPGTDGNVLFSRPRDELHHDEKVTRKAHLIDHAQLVLEALTVRWFVSLVITEGANGLQAPRQPLAGSGLDVFLERHPVWHRVAG